ncbi:MAG: DUF6673 family protein [Ruminococcus sp.]
MQDMYTVAINGVALHVDAEDAAFMQRYAAAAAAIPSQPTKYDADGIRQYCKSFRVFFDVLFGDGTADAVFADVPDNRREYEKIFMQLLKAMFEQRVAAKLRLVEAVKRYAPGEMV